MFPVPRRALAALGERLRLARLRRRFSATLVAERVGVSRPTLHKIEAGDPGVSIGHYVKVLRVLGLDKDLDQVAADDVIGRRLQDAGLPQFARNPRRRKAPVAPASEGSDDDD